MRFKSELCLAALVSLALGATSAIINESQASAQDVEFEVIGGGGLSGYVEETYLVVRTEAEWADVWEKHAAIYLSEIECPEINFSEEMVICAFMGKRPTTGYNISIEKMWLEEGKLHVEVAKHSPPKNAAVGEALTYPYVFVSLKKVDAEVVFHVTEETGTTVEYTLPELPTAVLTFALFLALSAAVAVLVRKT
jgi:hypothetical protein